MHDKGPVTLIGTTNGDSTTEETHEFRDDGVITGAMVGTEIGQRYALQNRAELIRDGSRTNLWEAKDKEYLAGNGRDYDLTLRYEFSEGDILRLEADNVNQDGNQYHHAMIINVDYETSITHRIRDAVRGLI